MTDPTYFPSGSAYVDLTGHAQAKMFGVDDSVSPAQPGWILAGNLGGNGAGTGFNLRGAWAANTTYAKNDVVTYQGSSYAAPAAFTSGSSFNASNWQLLAQMGATGASGSGTGTVNTGTAGQLAGYAANGTTVSGITLGSGLSLSGNTLSATGGSTSNTPHIIDGTSGTAVASTGSPYQMLATDRVLEINKTTGAATGLVWPTAPVLGELYTVIDGKGDAATNPITINFPSGVTGTITGWKANDGAANPTVVLNAAYDVITVRFTANAATGRVV